MATAFTMAARPKSVFFIDHGSDHGVEFSDEKYNPFDVYAPSEKPCIVQTSLTHWNRWRNALIVDPDGESGEINPSDSLFLQIPTCSGS